MEDLNGWYNLEGTHRYTGHMMDWDGADEYTNKRVFTVDGPGGEDLTVRHDGSLPEINVDNLAAGAITSGDVDCGAITSGDIDCGTIAANDGVNAGDVILKTRVLTGIIPSGTTVNIPHGLTGAGIRHFFISVAASSAWWRATAYLLDCHSWDNTNLIIEEADGFEGLPFTITIWYEA